MRPHYGALRALHAQPTASSHCRSSPTHRICYVATLSHQRDASKTELRDAYALDRALLAEDMKKNRRAETARSNKKIKAIEKMWASVGEAHAELLKKHELREYQLANATRELAEVKARLECYEPSNPTDWDEDEFDDLGTTEDAGTTATAEADDSAATAAAEGASEAKEGAADDVSTLDGESLDGDGKKKKKEKKKRNSDGSVDTTTSSKRNRAQQGAPGGEGGEGVEGGQAAAKKPGTKGGGGGGGAAAKAAVDKKEMMQMKGLIVRLKAKVKEEVEARTAFEEKVKTLEGKTIPLLNKEIKTGSNKIESQKEKISELKKVRRGRVASPTLPQHHSSLTRRLKRTHRRPDISYEHIPSFCRSVHAPID